MLGIRPKKDSDHALTAVIVGTAEISLARVIRAPGRPPLVSWWEVIAKPEGGDIAKSLKRLSKRHKLSRERCTTLLHSQDYRILLTNAPNVPTEERNQALRWVIKDLVEEPVQNLDLQVFDFPETSNDKEKQIYVVAARLASVADLVTKLRGNAIALEIVDILEMAQRNLAELLPENTRGTALLSITEDSGVITLSKLGTVYMTRRVEIQPQTWMQSPGEVYERIALEIQRSLDYYNRHFRQSPIEHVYLTPALVDLGGLVEYLARIFPFPPRIIELTEIVNWTTPPPVNAHAALSLAVGAALRREAEDTPNAPTDQLL